MADIRFIVSWGSGTVWNDSWMSNTLYFAVDGLPSDEQIQDLADDVRDRYAFYQWTNGSRIEVRAYNMADQKPRPERGFSTVTRTGGAMPNGPHQVALCLSYFSERNLPRQRGRIYIGPWDLPPRVPTLANQQTLIAFAQDMANIGGINVDWSVYSPTKAATGGDPTMSISDCWVDNSWDIQRRRKEPSTNRQVLVINE